jgi:hypothetical protein
MSDYAAIVERSSFEHKIAAQGLKPYWSTNSGDGRYCFVSFSGDDRVSVISYASGREVARIPVGDHPQRMRMGVVRSELFSTTAPQGTPAAPRLRVSVRPRRVQMRRPVRLRVRVTIRRRGRTVAVPGARVYAAGARATTGRRGWATLRKRYGLERVRRYPIRATLAGYRPGETRLRSLARP